MKHLYLRVFIILNWRKMALCVRLYFSIFLRMTINDERALSIDNLVESRRLSYDAHKEET